MSANAPLQRIIIDANTPSPSGCVIWLHGLGADGSDFMPVVEMLHRPDLRFILPHAPVRPVTLNAGYPMPAWYDIYSLDRDVQQDVTGIHAMAECVSKMIAEQVELGISSDRIMLAGFSQGGAMVLHTGLRYPSRLAGILALSTYLPLKPTLAHEKHAHNQHTPILMTHGIMDSVITLETAEVSRAVLVQEGFQVDWRTYPMAHTVCLEEIDDIRQFLAQHLPLA